MASITKKISDKACLPMRDTPDAGTGKEHSSEDARPVQKLLTVEEVRGASKSAISCRASPGVLAHAAKSLICICTWSRFPMYLSAFSPEVRMVTFLLIGIVA